MSTVSRFRKVAAPWKMAMAVFAVLGSCLVAGSAFAERIIRSFPHVETFDANNYSDLLWIPDDRSRQWHEWVPNGGWRGGAAKFHPPTSPQSYSGLGQFILNMSQVPEQLNVRWLMYHGSTWREYASGEKLIIFVRNGNRGRPMIILREDEYRGETYETMGACDGTVCRYEGGDFWPDGTDRLRIGNPPLAREEEWICVEFEANTRTGMIRLYIDTQDGELSGLYIERPMDDSGPGGTWAYVDIIGGFFNEASRWDENNYFMVDELVIDSRRIGPPEGFVQGPTRRPAAPTNVRVQ